MTTQEAVVVTWVEGGITPRLLSYKEAATYIGMKEGMIRTLVQQGRLPVVKLGAKDTERRIDVLDLNRFIEQQKDHFHSSNIPRQGHRRFTDFEEGERLRS
jgi:excisionase family DNA binding protein